MLPNETIFPCGILNVLLRIKGEKVVNENRIVIVIGIFKLVMERDSFCDTVLRNWMLVIITLK